MNYAQRYVANGAAVLDERGPENWRQTLYEKRADLDVYSVFYCPLGLLYDYFTRGREVLWPEVDFSRPNNNWEIVSNCGFDYGLDASAQELTAAWLELLDADVLV